MSPSVPSVATSTISPAANPAIAPVSAPLHERDGDEDDEEQVGRRAEHLHGRDRRHLEDRGDEHDRREAGGHGGAHGVASAASLRTSTSTASRDERLANGVTCTCLYGSVSVWPTLVTFPIGMPFG